MLIKVKDENRWVLFDNAEQVDYSNDYHQFTSQRDIGFLQGSDGGTSLTIICPNVEFSKISKDNPLKVGIIKFQRLQKAHVIVFNTLAYICNDQGKTVEKVDLK